MAEIILRPGRDRSVIKHHPWIFSGSISKVVGNPGQGDTVEIVDERGEWLARGAYSPNSNIRVRVWTWNDKDEITPDFFRERLLSALVLRQRSTRLINSNAYRLVHGESDGLPGCVIDRYDNTLVIQILSCGIEQWKEVLVELLKELTNVECIYERSDADVRKLEGLPLSDGLIWGKSPEREIEIIENESRFLVDIINGHKTGFYLDQRANRKAVGVFARSKDVLDCFCYTGGFTVAAVKNEAKSVYAVDTSTAALDLGKRHIELNGYPQDRVEWVIEDVFQLLRKLRDRGDKFDLVIMDPPKFASTPAHVNRAARGYKDINLLGLKLLRPGGILVTFSCSGGISADLFQKIVAGAALDASLDTRIIQRLAQDCDHPVALNFPEGAYLKGLVLTVN